VVLLLLVAPVFVGVVAHTIRSGEVFDAAATVCGAIAVLAVVAAVHAWRGRRSAKPANGSLSHLVRRERAQAPSSFFAK
jgi:hypothetical protein